MKKYVSEMCEGLPGMLLMSHGPLAMALAETAMMIAGEQKNFGAICFMDGDDAEEFGNEAAALVESFPENTVIMLDLHGGTPFNQMMRFVQEHGTARETVCGMNIPMLVNALLMREGMDAAAIAEDAVETGRFGIERVDTQALIATDVDDDDDDFDDDFDD